MVAVFEGSKLTILEPTNGHYDKLDPFTYSPHSLSPKDPS